MFLRLGATAGQTCYYAVTAADVNPTRGARSQAVSVIDSDSPATPDPSNERATLIAFNQATALTELEWLSFSSNQLTGSIPDLNTLTNLEVLDLGFEHLTVSIPDLSSLTNLNDLSFVDNRLNGSIPDLRALTNLTEQLQPAQEAVSNVSRRSHFRFWSKSGRSPGLACRFRCGIINCWHSFTAERIHPHLTNRQPVLWTDRQPLRRPLGRLYARLPTIATPGCRRTKICLSGRQ